MACSVSAELWKGRNIHWVYDTDRCLSPHFGHHELLQKNLSCSQRLAGNVSNLELSYHLNRFEAGRKRPPSGTGYLATHNFLPEHFGILPEPPPEPTSRIPTDSPNHLPFSSNHTYGVEGGYTHCMVSILGLWLLTTPPFKHFEFLAESTSQISTNCSK